MKLYCPHCGVKGAADDSYRGKKVKCPKCLETFIATETVAPDLKEVERPAAVAIEEPVSSDGQADRLIAEERATPAEETPPAETIPVDDAWEAEAPGETVEETEEETVEEAVEEEADETVWQATETEPAEVARVAEEVPAGEEAVLDWNTIAAEIEAKTVEAESREAEESEELPAALFADTTKEEPVQPVAEETIEPQAAESAASREEEIRFPEREEPEETPPETTPGFREESTAEASKVGESPEEDHFIFEEQKAEPEPVQVEDQPYGMIKEQCWQCGKKNRTGVPFTERSGRLYCQACLPAESEVSPETPAAGQGFAGPLPEQNDGPEVSMAEGKPRFAIGAALREAWAKTKGAKGPIWAGSAVMYLTILVLAAGGGFLLPMFGYDPTAPAPDTAGRIGDYTFQALIDAVSVLFSAGLLFMGIRKVAGDPISWKMIFTGFSDAGKIIVATILQSALIVLGLLVLVLPGIYLAIGYSMTIPLIVDRKMSPWQAMETSRKAVHRVWWRLTGLYLVMVLLFILSMVPLGIGLIWTWPMFVILAGVVYRALFGSEK